MVIHRMKNFLVALLLILLATPAWAATYYVKNGGSDAASGLSDELAWATIAKVNGSSFSPGDSILFKKGSTWREQLTVPSSGSAGLPITFGAYGSGADPIISGATDITGESWTLYSPEKVVDGGMENWTDATHLASWTMGGGAGSTLNQEATLIHGGTYAANLHSTGSYIQLYQDITLAASTQYTFYLWNYSSSTSYLYWKLLCAVVGDYNNYSLNGSDGQWYLASQINNLAHHDAYAKDTVTFTTPAAAGAYRIIFGNGSSGAYDYYVDDVSFLASASSNIYYTDVLSTDPTVLWLDAVTYKEAASIATVNITNRWYWSNGDHTVYIYATAAPNGFYSTIEAPARTSACAIPFRDYVEFDGLHFKYSTANTVVFNNAATYCKLSNCTITGAGYYTALLVIEQSDHLIVEDCTIISGSVIGIDTVRIGDSGGGIVTGTTIRRSTIKNGYHSTLKLLRSESGLYEQNIIKNDSAAYGRALEVLGFSGEGYNVIRHNWIEGSYIAGGGADDGNALAGEGNEFYGNVVTTGDSDGLVMGDGAWADGDIVNINNKAYNNVIYGFGRYGIYLGAQTYSPTGNLLENNIVYANGSAGQYQVYYLAGATTAAFNLINNLIYDPATSSTVYQGAARTVAYMEANDPTHWSANIVADPSFTNAAAGDFTLQAGSPCIEKGLNLGTTHLEMLLAGSTWPGSVSTADWHKTGGAPDIGAYDYRKVIW